MSETTRRERIASQPSPGRSGEGSRDQIRILNPMLRNGFAQVPSPVMRARGLSHQAVRLYGLLLDYSWSDNACFPGQPRLAADLDLKSVRSVYTILTELREFGLIDWHRRPNNSNVYLLLDFTQDPRLAIRRTTDGKPYLERVVPAASADAPRPDRKNTATPKTGTSDRNYTAEPERPVRTSTTEPERQNAADEAYPVKEYTEISTIIPTGLSTDKERTAEGLMPGAASVVLGGLGLAAIWASALDELRGRLSEANYRNWVLSAKLVGVEDDRLVIAASSSFARDWLDERLADDVARAIARVTGTWLEVRFVVRGSPDN